MLRLILTLLMLLTLRPDTAAASCDVQDSSEQTRYVRSDPGFGRGALRAGSGVDLIVESTLRRIERYGSEDSNPGPPHRPGLVTPSTPPDLLATLSQRVITVRESRTPSPESPYLVYLPYHANPPPASL